MYSNKYIVKNASNTTEERRLGTPHSVCTPIMSIGFLSGRLSLQKCLRPHQYSTDHYQLLNLHNPVQSWTEMDASF